MITDGRFCLRAQDPKTLWRYDSKRRKTSLIDVAHRNTLLSREGTGALLLVSAEADRDISSGIPGSVTATIHMPEHPEEPVATGEFCKGKWSFAGISESWALVPDYIVLPGVDDGVVSHLLRIADDGKLTALGELGVVFDAINVPESRLLVIAGGGGLSILDPVSGRSAAKMRLGQNTQRPVARFRSRGDESELWLNDGCLLMKLETKDWHIVDAAGTDDESDIQAWAFVGESMIAVIPSGKAEVMLIDIDEMALVETYFPPSPLVDVALQPSNGLVGVDADGKAWEAKLPK